MRPVAPTDSAPANAPGGRLRAAESPGATKQAARERLAAIGIAPRGLELDLAAAYVGLSAPSFLAQVEAGRMPAPTSLGRRRVWDRRALDRAMDRLSGLPSAPAGDAADRLHDEMMGEIEADGRPGA